MESAFSPALCTWYEPHRLAFPCFAQPKLNGLRATYIDGHLFSRSGHRWNDRLLEHILQPLRHHLRKTRNRRKPLLLDGEFYRHGWTLDRIAEAASLFRTAPHPDTLEIGFYVFDLVAELPFPERYNLYCQALDSQHSTTDTQPLLSVRPVPALRADSVAAADAIHAWNIRTGFEGTIYRTGQGAYTGGRCQSLMKRKEKRGSGFTNPRRTTEFKPRQHLWPAQVTTS